MDIGNGLVDTQSGEGEAGWIESSIDICTLPCLTQLTRGKLGCNTESSAHCSMMMWGAGQGVGGGLDGGPRGRGYMIHRADSRCFTAETQQRKAIILQFKNELIFKCTVWKGGENGNTAVGFPGGVRGEEPACQCRRPSERQFQSLYWENPLGKETATHSSILAWRIPWTEEPGRIQSTGLKRVRHN